MADAYARIKKGLTLRSKEYTFRKDAWTLVKSKDVGYFLNYHEKRIEFAPLGKAPKDKIKESPDGVIVTEGHGEDTVITTKEKDENVSEKLDVEEEDAITRIREKYRHKKEQKEKEKEEQKKKELEEKKLKKKEEKEKKKKEKDDKTKDITNKNYVQNKNKNKGEEL